MKKIGKCISCGKMGDIRHAGNCQGCYKYIKNGGMIHEKPKYGEVKNDPDGKPVCHICGRSYIKLGAHIRESHKMTRKEYSEMFGLDRTKGICAKDHREVLRERVMENYEVSVSKNLISKGIHTRFKKGDKGRTADKMSAQTFKRVQELGRRTGVENVKNTPSHKGGC